MGTIDDLNRNPIKYDKTVRSVSDITDMKIKFHTIELKYSGFKPCCPKVRCVTEIVITVEIKVMINDNNITAIVLIQNRFFFLPK